MEVKQVQNPKHMIYGKKFNLKEVPFHYQVSEFKRQGKIKDVQIRDDLVPEKEFYIWVYYVQQHSEVQPERVGHPTLWAQSSYISFSECLTLL